MELPVRAVNRSGDRPDLLPTDVELVTADAADPKQAVKAARGASVIYQALNPPYHQWQQYFAGLQAGALAAAKAVGARYVSIENLYMYDSSEPIMESTAIRPRSKKGELKNNHSSDKPTVFVARTNMVDPPISRMIYADTNKEVGGEHRHR